MNNELDEKFKAELKRFQEAQKDMKTEILPLIKEASQKLREAVAVANKYGLPHRFPLSFISQWYVPESFNQWSPLRDKCSDLLDEASPDDELDDAVVELAEEYCSGEYPGWQHSAVC